MCGGLSVISDVNKLSVYRLANWINKVSPNRIPQNIISKPPSAELAPGQVDPFDYNIGTTRVVCNPRGYKGADPQADVFELKFLDI